MIEGLKVAVSSATVANLAVRTEDRHWPCAPFEGIARAYCAIVNA